MLYYKDYFDVSKDVPSCMTREEINREPGRWMQFYPHESFVELLRKMLQSLDGGDKSIWLTGAYGTGKSHAALVLQKLFMDDESRVNEWLERRSKQIPETVRAALKAQRDANVFVVFDTKSDGLTTPAQFLVRIENCIIQALKERGCQIPVFGAMEKILDRIQEEEESFFRVRDSIQDRLIYLSKDITNFDDLKKALSRPELQPYLLSDIMDVLHARDIYINPTSENLIVWINKVLEVNHISKMFLIWDEFSSYIDQNRSQLKTFEEIAEMAQGGKFFFMPVTHMKLEAYLSTGSESAKKANDRFVFQTLDMPTHTALVLAADAFHVTNADWSNVQTALWHSISPVVTNYMAQKDAECTEKPEHFKGILPIHPMTAFVLKFLSTAVGSNQRSMFSFLKGEIGESEFQTFIATSGPELKGRQFLTVDHLWHYFIERNDLGTGKEVNEVRIEFATKSKNLDETEKRVFKAVLLYSLLGRLTANSGHELIQPAVDNIKRSFEGDGSIVGIDTVIGALEKKHCFSIINGRCEMFRASGDSADIEKQKERIHEQFNEQVLNLKALPKLESAIKRFKDHLHFEARVANVDKAGLCCQKLKDQFGESGNKILLQFIIARDAEEQLRAADKAKELAVQWRGFRMLFIILPELHFCSMRSTYWEEYVDQLAHIALATDQATKTNYETQIKLMDGQWLSKLTSLSQRLVIYKPNTNGDPFMEERQWNNVEPYLKQYLHECFECFMDDLSGYNTTVMSEPGSAYKAWALAGMDFASAKGTYMNMVNTFGKNGITGSPDWFETHPTHPLTHLRDFCHSKLQNALNGTTGVCSIRKIFIDLQKPPFALRAIPFSAFVMGFAMKEWLNNPRQQLQWTNGSLSDKLDNETLAEMIETVLKDNGNNAIKNEKMICRISREEKKFIECSAAMFGIERIPNATVEGTLDQIARRLEKISEKAPLWVLPDYIYDQEEPQADNCKAIVEDLCEALKISSKGNQIDRTNRIKAIGKRLEETAGLTELFAKFVRPEIFESAFKMLVDRNKPTLREWAEKVGDASGMYCNIIKDHHFTETTSWLWNRQNVEDELELVEAQYKIISVVQSIIGTKGYISFEDAIKRVKKAIYEENKISVELLACDYPSLTRFVQVMDSSKIADGLKDLAELFMNHGEMIKNLFFDPAKQVQLAILKKLFENQISSLGETELQKLYESLSAGAKRAADDFRKAVFQEIDEYMKQSTVQQIFALWQKKTNSETPAAWSLAHKMPAAVLFPSADSAQKVIAVLNNPTAYQSGILKKVKIKLDELAFTENDELANGFLKLVVPAKYAGLSLDADALGVFLIQKLGNHPDEWLLQLNNLRDTVEKYVREQYAAAYKTKAMDKVKAMPEAEAKKLLLKFAADNPDVGLGILE